MFKEYLVRISIDGITRDVVVPATTSFNAKDHALRENNADFAFVLRELPICEECES